MEWKYLSKEGNHLVDRMLNQDANKRISIIEALNHPFFKRFNIRIEVQQDKLFDYYKNIRTFKTDKRSFFQHAAYSYMIHNLARKEEIGDIRKLFIQFDDDCSGSLTVDEILDGLKKVIPTTSDRDKLRENLDNLNQGQSGGFEYGGNIIINIILKCLLFTNYL